MKTAQIINFNETVLKNSGYELDNVRGVRTVSYYQASLNGALKAIEEKTDEFIEVLKKSKTGWMNVRRKAGANPVLLHFSKVD